MNQSRRSTTEPKAAWISQAEYSSRTNRSVERVRYLHELRPLIQRHAEQYFQAQPDGEQVTLACLEAIEETHLERLSIEFNLSCRTVKQDLGILVPLVLIELVGADGLETYRHRESLKNSTRSCPKSFAQRSWVSRYTPHRLTQFGRMRLSDRRLKRPSLEPSRNQPAARPAKPTPMPVHLL